MEYVFLALAVILAVALAVLYKRYADARSASATLEARLAASAETQDLLKKQLDDAMASLEEAGARLSSAREQAAAAEASLAAAESKYQELTRLHAADTEQLGSLREALSAAKEENSALKTRHELLEKRFAEMQAAAEERFRNIANEILSDNSATFKRQNAERLGEILSPLNERIEEFRKRVEEIYADENREIFSLKDRLKELREVGETMSRDARELSGALRGNTGVQGQWGEMVLETILEQSGLRRGYEYKVQVTRDTDGNLLSTDDGSNLRPDVVVNYPDGRCVVIDSKSSMTAYLEYVSATDEKSRTQAGREHVASVRRHMEKLSAKRYDDLLGDSSLDFVMMFIPSDAAYMAVMHLDPALWQQAYEKRVLIVSPSHLVSALKIIEQLWRRERQTANVVKIADEAGKMYDKFVAFVTDIQKIGAAIDSSRRNYDAALNKLTSGTGNLVGRAEKLRTLGVKASKSLPKSLLTEISSESDADGAAADGDSDNQLLAE